MAKIHQSLYKRPRLLGLEYRTVVFIVMLAIYFVLYSPMPIKWIGVLFEVLIWVVIALVNRYDTFGFEILWQYLRQQDYYPAQAKDSKFKYKYDKSGIL